MNTSCHCASVVASGTHPPTFVQRSLTCASWLIPSVILTLLPKCPACLVAYIALGTGLGLSFSTALYVKTLLVILCVLALLYSAARHLPRLISLRCTSQETVQ